MAQIYVSDTVAQGFRVLTLSNGQLSFTLVPELGGKISSIRDQRIGREWLWTSTHLAYRRLPYGISYIREGDMGGWDECFPTVVPCAYPLEPWRGVTIPDHGEVWPAAWSAAVTGDPSRALTARTAARGTVLPYLFERAITLSAETATLRCDYRIRNLADVDIAFIWSAHPLFAIEPGTHVLLPTDTRVHVWMSVPPHLLSYATVYTWPPRVRTADDEWDLSHVPDPSARIACKLWSEPLSRGDVALQAPAGEYRVTFDPMTLPQVGLWINAGAWSGTGGEPYYNLALEPCIGAQDSLAEAIERGGPYGTLPTRSVRTWSLIVHLGTHAEPIAR